MKTTAPEVIVTVARIHTMNSEPERHGQPQPDSVAITDGVISAIGTLAEVSAHADQATVRIELPGSTLVPAFTDAHAHPISAVTLPGGTDLSGLQHRDEVIDALKRGAAEQTESEWFFAQGLDPNIFGDDPVTNRVISDAIGPGRPAYVAMYDGHSALISDTFLVLAGITSGHRFDDGSSYVADSQGRPTGHILEFDAMREVRKHLPQPALAEQAQALHDLLNEMAATGIAKVHVMELPSSNTIELLNEAESIAPLPVILRLSPWCEPTTSDADMEQLIAMQGLRGDRWEIGGIKLFIDGTVEGGTAWLETPDSRGECTESLWRNPDAYARRIAQFHAAGVPTATHAIGERGVRFVVETIAGLPKSGVQHRIEHIESVSGEVIQQLAAAGIAASMQPTHCTHFTRADGTDEWSKRLGEERAHRAWCMRDVRDSGAILALSSDFPVAPFDPLKSMADAQLRRPSGDRSMAPVLPEQRLTALEALEGYTTHAGASIGELSGRVSVGQPAFFTVLDIDPLAADPEQLALGRALLTVSDGLITHRA